MFVASNDANQRDWLARLGRWDDAKSRPQDDAVERWLPIGVQWITARPQRARGLRAVRRAGRYELDRGRVELLGHLFIGVVRFCAGVRQRYDRGGDLRSDRGSAAGPDSRRDGGRICSARSRLQAANKIGGGVDSIDRGAHVVSSGVLHGASQHRVQGGLRIGIAEIARAAEEE